MAPLRPFFDHQPLGNAQVHGGLNSSSYTGQGTGQEHRCTERNSLLVLYVTSTLAPSLRALRCPPLRVTEGAPPGIRLQYKSVLIYSTLLSGRKVPSMHGINVFDSLVSQPTLLQQFGCFLHVVPATSRGARGQEKKKDRNNLGPADRQDCFFHDRQATVTRMQDADVRAEVGLTPGSSG